MAEHDDDQSGKSLRDRLEETVAERAALAKELHTYKVRDVLTEKGLKLVNPEDLEGVDLTQVEAKAQEIQGKRVEMQKVLLKDALARQGVAEDDLEAMVTDLLTEKQAASPEAEATRRAQSVGRAEGSLVPRVNPNDLHGFDAIKAGLEQKPHKR